MKAIFAMAFTPELSGDVHGNYILSDGNFYFAESLILQGTGSDARSVGDLNLNAIRL